MRYLETVDVGSHRNQVDFRFPVQLAVRPHQDFRGFAGQVASGRVALGDEVLVLPSRQRSRVRAIVAGGDDVEEARQGDSVILSLEHEIDVSRGDMIVHPHNPPQLDDYLEATICWLSSEPLDPARPYLLQHTTHSVRAAVRRIHHRIDVDTLEEHPADTLQLNEIAQVSLHTTSPLFYDEYASNRATGSFILIDAFTHNTVAAGMLRRRGQGAARLRSTNVVWEGVAVGRLQREQRNGHLGAVLWFTGLSGAGKSTVAQALERRLFEMGCQTFYLDGDNVRHGLNGDLGFDAESRKENIRRVAEVARLAYDHGQLALCTFISPYRADRETARGLLPQGRFIEIAVQCSIEECMRRDPKGLYAKALAGKLPEFTGVSSPYEEPLAPEITIATDELSVEACVEKIVQELRRRGILPLPDAAEGAGI
jgi:bifunctional enzyme CysN/CysC